MTQVERKRGETLCTITLEGDHGTQVIQGLLLDAGVVHGCVKPIEALIGSMRGMVYSVCASFPCKSAVKRGLA